MAATGRRTSAPFFFFFEGCVNRMVCSYIFECITFYYTNTVAIYQNILNFITAVWCNRKGLIFTFFNRNCSRWRDGTTSIGCCSNIKIFLCFFLDIYFHQKTFICCCIITCNKIMCRFIILLRRSIPLYIITINLHQIIISTYSCICFIAHRNHCLICIFSVIFCTIFCIGE